MPVAVIDLTRTLCDDMPVFPGDNPVRLKPAATIEKHGFTNYRIETGMHVGTHLDGPLHMIPGGMPLTDMPPERFVGRGVLVDARKCGEIIHSDILEPYSISQGDIVLFRTDWCAQFGTETYYFDYPVLEPRCADLLVQLKVNMIGLDFPSPDKAPFPVHQILLGNNILIIENLQGLANLKGVGKFRICALPLKLEADSAPARVIALTEEDEAI